MIAGEVGSVSIAMMGQEEFAAWGREDSQPAGTSTLPSRVWVEGNWTARPRTPGRLFVP